MSLERLNSESTPLWDLGVPNWAWEEEGAMKIATQSSLPEGENGAHDLHGSEGCGGAPGAGH